MSISFGQALFQNLTAQWKAERNEQIIKMKYKTVIKQLQTIKKNEKKKEDKNINLLNEIQKLIQHENQNLFQKMIVENNSLKSHINLLKMENEKLNQKLKDEINILRNEIKTNKETIETSNKNLKDEINILRNEIKTNKETIETSNKNIIDKNLILEFKIDSLNSQLIIINQNIKQLIEANENRSSDESEQNEVEEEVPLYNDDTDNILDAIVKGSLQGVKYHYYHGNPDVFDQYHNSPLHIASKFDYGAIVRFLLEKGEEIDSLCNKDSTPLMWAAKNGHLCPMNQLLDYGANINKEDDNLETPLHWAVRGNHLESCRLLIERGADPSIRNRWGNTPYEYANFLGRTSISNYLLAYDI